MRYEERRRRVDGCEGKGKRYGEVTFGCNCASCTLNASLHMDKRDAGVDEVGLHKGLDVMIGHEFVREKEG
jgi:hypothetical protein